MGYIVLHRPPGGIDHAVGPFPTKSAARIYIGHEDRPPGRSTIVPLITLSEETK